MWSPGVSLEDIEKQVILKAFAHYRDNKTVTANALGISIRTLDSRLDKYASDKKEQEVTDEQRRRDRENQLRRARGQPQLPDAYTERVSSEGASAIAAPSAEAFQGNGVQPSKDAPAQHAVSVPERAQVQKVLPQQSPYGGNRGKR